MPRINIYLNKNDLANLKKYLNQNYPKQQAQSLIVATAIREYIKRKTTKYEVAHG